MKRPHGTGLGITLLAAVVFLLTAGIAGFAQVPETAQLREPASILKSVTGQVAGFEERVEANQDNDAELVAVRLELEQATAGLPDILAGLQPRLAEIDARLEQIGPPPGEGVPPEPEAVSNERNALLSEKAETNILIGQAEKASRDVASLTQKIDALRRDLFNRTLYKRYRIGDALNGEVYRALKAEAAKLRRKFADWWRFVFNVKLPSLIGSAALSLLVAAVLLIGGWRLFSGLLERDENLEEPSPLSRLSVAFWSTFVPTLAVAAFFATSLVLFDNFGVVRGDIAAILTTLAAVLTTVFFIQRLANAILSPAYSNWSVLDVRPAAARILVWLVSATAVVTGIDALLTTVSAVLDSPLSLTVAKHFFATILVGVLVILIGLIKPFGEDAEPSPWPAYIRQLMFVVGGVPILAALLGYIGLARFASQQIVLTGAILATMYLGYLSSRAVSHEGAFAQTYFGRLLADRYGYDDRRVDQIGLVTSVLIKLVVVLVGVPLILIFWGFQPGDIEAWFLRSATEIQIGSITFSLMGILTGLLVFVVGYLLTRRFQRWLDRSVMSRGRVDSGVRNSIRMGIGYLGFALAAIIAVSAAGINLSNLALVAGALSVGIGFGLQNIVSNFVSGLILLAERPFKAGDWIVAGPVSGTVKKISVRATEIETFQRQTVILPNSELINSAVGNWTHRNRVARVEIPVGVAYGTDPELVRSILLEIGKAHPHAVKEPEPHVLFQNFGDSSLDFELRLFTSDVDYLLTIQSDIRFQITEAFASHGIEIPFPQRDLHLKIPEDQDIDAALSAAAGKAKRKSTPTRRLPDPE